MPPAPVPVRYDIAGNAPEVVLKPEQVISQWKTKHLYEIAFTSNEDLAVLFGDVDVAVPTAMTEPEFHTLDEQYKLSLVNFIGSHQFALASASSYEARKISWRFYVPDLVGTAQAQKEYAEAVNKDKGILLPDGTPVRLDLSVYHPNRKMRMLHAWKQTKDENGRLETDRSKWENRPLRLVVGREQDTILHSVSENAERLTSRRREVPLHHDDFDLVRKLVLECLAENRSTEYISWVRGIWAIKSVENSARGLELAHDFSKKSYKYDPRAVEHAWREGKDKITAGSIHFWAKADNPVKYAELTARLPIPFLEKNINEGDEGLANIFVKAFEGTLVSINSKQKTFYAFNPKTGLWAEVNSEYIVTLFTGTMKSILTPLAVKVAHEYKDVADTDEGKAMKKKMEQTLVLIKTMTLTKTATKCFPQIYTKMSEPVEWMNKLNARHDLLPVKNGVLDLRTGNLRPYELEDYLTYKVDVVFDPSADTSRQTRFFRDVLMGDEDAVNFTQYFLGYGITGEINRQQMLVLEGCPDGSNAKSSLISCLGDVLGKPMLSTANRKIFNMRETENNDSLYNARHARILVVPELNKNTQLDEGMIKNMTGDDEVDVSAKYKTNITFVPRFKVVMPLNNMFSVPAEQGAMWRRILLIQFKVRFLSRDDVNWDDELAEQGLMKEKDERFANELKHDNAGWLKWLVDGAKMYYDDPERVAPPSLQKHLLQAKQENDPYLKYVRKEYAFTGKEEDFVPVVDILTGYGATEDTKTLARRIATAMKTMKAKKSTRSIYPTMWRDGKEMEDKSGKSKITKVWVGVRRKTLDEKEADEEE